MDLPGYGRSKLLRVRPASVVALNHAAAVAIARGPEAGLVLLAERAQHDHLQSYVPYHAARADLHRRAGRYDEAASDYTRAPSDPEMRDIARRLAEARARVR